MSVVQKRFSYQKDILFSELTEAAGYTLGNIKTAVNRPPEKGD